MDIKTTRQPTGEWVAIDADNYDVESDSVGAWSSSPVGYGLTETAAIRELLEEIEERANARPRTEKAK
jgi:hypothetical protein